MTDGADLPPLGGDDIGAQAARPAAVIELDDDVLAWFVERATSAGHADLHALVHAVLRDHIRRAGEPLERTLRRVLREELRKAG